MSYRVPRLLALLLPCLFLLSSSASAQGGFAVYVNTTEDLPGQANHCLPQQDCPLRSAIERIESAGMQGTIRACYEPGTPGAKRCSPLAKPLSREDPGYDAATGKWYFEFAENGLAYSLSENGTTFDFTLDVEDWSSPADNKIVIAPGPGQLEHAFVIESSGNTFKGFDVEGDFQIAAFVVRQGLLGDGATNNQFGPGLALYGIRPAVGIQIRDRSSSGNRVLGNWCGITGDGTVRRPLQDDCVQITYGSGGNTIGGDGANRNIFAASTLGSGVSITQDSSGNKVIGNLFGLDVAGQPAGLQAGVTVKIGSNDTEIAANIVSGADTSGISVYDGSYRTHIHDNLIGLQADAETCAGNGQLGIQINNGVNETRIERNSVACNDKGGISIAGSGARANLITRNAVWNNNGIGIQVSQGANGGVKPPKINSASARRVVGTASSCRGGDVEIFSDERGEARWYEGTVKAEATTGLFIFEAPASIDRKFVTANCTDINRNSSALSEPVSIQGGGNTPTQVPTAVPPTPDPNATSVPQLYNLFAPVVFKTFGSR